MLHRRLLILALLALTLTAPLDAGAAGPDRAACAADPNGAGCVAGLPSAEYQLLLDEMLLHPAPDVRPLEPNMDEVNRFAFRKIVGGAVTIYDAPNGNPIGTIDPGFNYVTVGRQDGDWVQINDGQWMPASQL